MSQHPKMALHNRTLSLPAGGGTSTSALIDGAATPLPEHAGDIVAVLDAPALTTAQLPNGETITYSFLESNNADLSSPISTTQLGVQSGAGGAGAAAAVFGCRPKNAGGKYWGFKAVASASAAATAATAKLSLVSQKAG